MKRCRGGGVERCGDKRRAGGEMRGREMCEMRRYTEERCEMRCKVGWGVRDTEIPTSRDISSRGMIQTRDGETDVGGAASHWERSRWRDYSRKKKTQD